MKLLHVISSIDPRGGGPIEALKQLYIPLTAMGNQMEVACLDNSSASFLKDVPFPVYALGPSYTGYRYNPKLVTWLKSRASNYDAIIVRGIWQYHSLAVWRALASTNTPYFVFTHGMLDPWFKHAYPLKHVKKWLYWPWAEYRVLRDARAVLFTSEEERLLARESFWLYRCNEAVVNYGTAIPAGNANAQRRLFLDNYPELENKRLLLFLSRIHPKKGCDILIEAFSRIAGRDHSLHLIMAGPDQIGWKGDLVKLSEKLGVADRITWTGMLTGDLKWGAYHAAEVFVLPSHQENFGIVVAESLAAGTPVLISNKVNIWREVERDKAGLIAEDNTASLADFLNQWLELPVKERVTVSELAKNCFVTRFEITEASKSLIETIQGLI